MRCSTPFALLAAAATLALFACDPAPGLDTKEGDPCTSGGQCAETQFCFVPLQGEKGYCRTIPAECGDSDRCNGTCFDAIRAECRDGTYCETSQRQMTLECLGGLAEGGANAGGAGGANSSAGGNHAGGENAGGNHASGAGGATASAGGANAGGSGGANAGGAMP